MRRWSVLLVCCLLGLGHRAFAQNIYQSRQFQFLSFEAIPTWTGVVTDWDKAEPTIHLYDTEKYKGHAQYVSVALKTGITFAQFKAQVRDPKNRKFLPFFLYDLRKRPIDLNGKAYTWALRIEDYAYLDTDAQMVATTLRLLQRVADYIRQATGQSNSGFILLSSNPKTQPNARLAPALAQAGFPQQTEKQLVRSMGGESVHILNPGKGFGYLRFVPIGEENNVHLGAHDIAVYESMPARVPPVSGIVTLEPQTPLSHVNLLAKNRGTVNLYALDTTAIPGLHAQIGRLVKLECTDQRISLHAATEKDAQAFWAAHSPKITLPEANTTVSGIQNLAAICTANVVGAKAANYSRIQRLVQGNVNPGFAIPFYYYQKALEKSLAPERITNFLAAVPSSSPEQIAIGLEEIQRDIRTSRIDPELILAIAELAKTQYGNRRIRLRSSTNCEDLPSFNGAGLYLSKGWNPEDGLQKLEGKILQIYASLWTPIAFAEREYYGIDHSKAMMAILINEAFDHEYANGVVLTIPDKTGYAIAINTQWGDSAVTNPTNGQIPEALLFKTSDSKTYVVESHSNIHDIFLQPDMALLLEELRLLSIRIHKDFQLLNPNQKGLAYGVDIEFKIMEAEDGLSIFIKQARPLGQVLPE